MNTTPINHLTNSSFRRFSGGVGLILAAILLVTGCIERTVTVNTEPPDATVILNDQEVGTSPVRVPFTWYGDYDVIIRKKDYKTLRTHERLETPWYQLPGIDLFTECFIPFTVHDDHVMQTFVLEPQTTPDRKQLLEAAETMKQEALAVEIGEPPAKL